MKIAQIERVLEDARLGYMVPAKDVLALWEYHKARLNEKNAVLERIDAALRGMP